MENTTYNRVFKHVKAVIDKQKNYVDINVKAVESCLAQFKAELNKN